MAPEKPLRFCFLQVRGQEPARKDNSCFCFSLARRVNGTEISSSQRAEVPGQHRELPELSPPGEGVEVIVASIRAGKQHWVCTSRHIHIRNVPPGAGRCSQRCLLASTSCWQSLAAETAWHKGTALESLLPRVFLEKEKIIKPEVYWQKEGKQRCK